MSKLTPEELAQIEAERIAYAAWEQTRRIDALIAEYIFGWQWFLTSHNTDQKVIAPDQESANQLHIGAHVLELALPYCTDIAAAWLIANWTRERDGHFQVQCDFGGRWTAVITLPLAKDDPRRIQFIGAWSHSGEADTAPPAICLATLDAVGVSAE